MGISDDIGEEVKQPTVDCFTLKINKQECCHKYITPKENFFSAKFDNPKIWKHEIAWSNPPFERDIIREVLNSYMERKIHGYICVPDMPKKDPSWWKIAEKHKKSLYKFIQPPNDMFLGPYTGSKIRFNIAIFYFDFRQN